MSDSKKATQSFLRQSAWMILATVGGGAAMMLVHTIVGKTGDRAYAQFKALLGTFYLLGAAGGALATLFAQQTAAAVTPEQERQVSTAARRVALAILIAGGLLALLLIPNVERLTALWKLDNPVALWVTGLLGLLSLWGNLGRGLAQGCQNFFALGVAGILDGFGRLIAVAVIVISFGGLAAGAMTGAAIGASLALLILIWGSWAVLNRAPAEGFRWGPWMRRFLPLTVGFGVLQFLLNFDNLYWQSLIPAAAQDHWLLGRHYSPAQTIGFGLTQFTLPLAAVMLPRIARSAATGEASDSLRLTLITTLVLGGTAAVGCTLFPKLPLQVMFFSKKENWEAAPLVPWFAWAMLSYTLANLFLNNLFARERFGVVPWMAVVAAGYAGCLWVLRGHLLAMEPLTAYKTVVGTLALANLALFALAAWFSRSLRSKPGGERPRLE